MFSFHTMDHSRAFKSGLNVAVCLSGKPVAPVISYHKFRKHCHTKHKITIRWFDRHHTGQSKTLELAELCPRKSTTAHEAQIGFLFEYDPTNAGFTSRLHCTMETNTISALVAVTLQQWQNISGFNNGVLGLTRVGFQISGCEVVINVGIP